MTESNVTLEIEEVDKYQFVDVPILITANLMDLTTNLRKLGETSNVKVLLAFEGNASVEHRCREHHPNLLEVVSNTGIQEDGTAKIEIKIKDVSMNHENQKFVVYLEAYRPHGENNIICAISNPITCVRHKLVLSEAYTAPYIWYKDEGAKDKCIRILVKLIDSSKNLVKDRNIVLVPTLIYSSGLSVQPANVLNLFHDRDKPFMIGHNGTDVIRFRVNEVSRNHRKQLFHLLITPDLSSNPAAADISPAISLAFEVKSKRTSDAKKEQLLSRNEDDSDDEFVSIVPTKSFSVDAAPLDHPLSSASKSSNPLVASSTANKGNEIESVKTPHASAVSPRGMNVEKISNGNKRSLPFHTEGNVSNALPTDSESSQGNFDHPARNLHISTAPLLNRESEVYKGNGFPLSSEETIDTPLQALSHLIEWMNASYSAMSSLRASRSSSQNSAEIDELVNQLIDVYPIRTLGSMQFLQQFLSIHESYLLQQNQLVFQFYQQQQHFNNFAGIGGSGRHDHHPTPRTVGYPLGSVNRLATPATVPGFSLPGNLSMPSPLASFAIAARSGKVDTSTTRNLRAYPVADPLLNRYPRFLQYNDFKRRRLEGTGMVDSSSPLATVIPNSVSSFESLITVVVSKYVKVPKDEKEFLYLGIPAFSTLFPPIRLVGFFQKNSGNNSNSNIKSAAATEGLLGDWVFKPLQSIAVLNDPEISGLVYEEIMELVENSEFAQNGFVHDLARYQSNLNILKREIFNRFADFDPENNRINDGQYVSGQFYNSTAFNNMKTTHAHFLATVLQ